MPINLLSSITSIFVSLLGITGIIVFHEFGHFIFCKLFNIYTPTFSIGMGKVIYSKKIGQTNFCLSAAPIGGYVEIASEKGIKGTKGFDEVPYYQKCLIMLGGILCNFLLTYLIFMGLFFTGIPESGLPYETNTVFVSAVPESSINKNNLKVKDKIISVNETPIQESTTTLQKVINKQLAINENQVKAIILRDNKEVPVQLNIQNKEHPSISNSLEIVFEKKAPLSIYNSAVQAYKTTVHCLQSIIVGLKNLISANPLKGFVGPIMAVAISSKSAQKGMSHLLLLLAIISINLGFMNLLPLPIFDGGQFVIFSIEELSRKKLSEKVKHAIGISSWILALGLMALFSLRDLHSLIFG